MEHGLNTSDHPAVAAWKQLAGSSSVPDEVEAVTRDWKKKTARPVYRLKGVNTRTRTVIAKPCTRDEAMRTFTIYQEILPHVPITCPEVLGTIRGQRKIDTWMFLEDIPGAEYRPGLVEHRRLAGRWLATVHTAATEAGSPNTLAGLDYLYDTGPNKIIDYLKTTLARLPEVISNPALSRFDLRVLASIARQCDFVAGHWHELESFCISIPSTLVHGDFCVSNMLVHDRGGKESLVVFDWQRSGWASPAFDLTRFLGSWVDPDLRSYLAIARKHWPFMDEKTVRRLGYVGEVHRWIEALRWEVERLRYEWVEEPMARIRVYEDWMNDIREAAPWRDNPALSEGGWRSILPYSRPGRLQRGQSVHS